MYNYIYILNGQIENFHHSKTSVLRMNLYREKFKFKPGLINFLNNANKYKSRG